MIHVLGDLSSGGLLPEGLWQAPVQHHGIFGSGTGTLDSVGDVFGFSEVFLGEAAALAVPPPPEGEIIIGASVNGLGFESLHVAPLNVVRQFRA